MSWQHAAKEVPAYVISLPELCDNELFSNVLILLTQFFCKWSSLLKHHPIPVNDESINKMLAKTSCRMVPPKKNLSSATEGKPAPLLKRKSWKRHCLQCTVSQIQTGNILYHLAFSYWSFFEIRNC